MVVASYYDLQQDELASLQQDCVLATAPAVKRCSHLPSLQQALLGVQQSDDLPELTILWHFGTSSALAASCALTAPGFRSYWQQPGNLSYAALGAVKSGYHIRTQPPPFGSSCRLSWKSRRRLLVFWHLHSNWQCLRLHFSRRSQLFFYTCRSCPRLLFAHYKVAVQRRS